MINRRQFLSLAALGITPLPSLAAALIETSGDLAGQATVLGRLPADLNGIFYRNGPGRFELGGERYHHWFDGDGFAQRWQIADGKVSHAGRFVATQKFEEENRAGHFLYSTFGTHIGRKGAKNNDAMNTANTNLLPFNGGVYALWEGGSATELDPQTLTTRGVEIYRLNTKGEIKRTAMIPVPDLNMVHDFVVSGRHLAFLLAPYDMRPAPDRSLADSLHWVGGNAYEDGACTRLDAVLHDGDALLKTSLPARDTIRPLSDNRSNAVQIVLDYASGQAREARLFGTSEFPRVAPQVVSARHRKLLVLGASGRELILDSVNLIDTDSGKVDGYAFGAGWEVEEHVLVPRRGARSETDGYVVGVAQDTHHGQTVLTVFDAHNIKAGPRALARLPYRAPLCFHGNFLAS